MKRKILIITILSMLLIGSMSASSEKINNEVKVNVEQSDSDIIEIDVGDIIIDCQYDDDLAVEIIVPSDTNEPYKKINPQNSDKVTFRFLLDWEIKNPQLLQWEKYYFEIELIDCNTEGNPIIDVKSHTEEGTLGDISGRLFSGDISIGRDDFNKDYFFNEPETLEILAKLRGIYYQGMNDETVVDDDTSSTRTRIDLENQRPSKPTLTSNDISDGGEGNYEETYTFTASGSTDHDGDEIKYYYFNFHETQNNKIKEIENVDGSASTSHTWTDKGIKRVSVYTKDKFGAQSDTEEWSFTLPRSKEKSRLNCFEIFERFPAITSLLERILSKNIFF